MLFTIWVTKMCNFRCEYCYEGIEKEKSFLKENTANDIVNFILNLCEERKKYEIKIRFHGGEPLLNIKVIKQIISELEKKNINNRYKFIYEMTTNGYLLNDDNLEYVASKIQEISISLDGNKKSNDSMRILTNGEGTYDKVIENAKNFMKIRNDFSIRMTINTKNVNEIYNNITHLIEQGFTSIISVIDIGDDKWNIETLDYLEEQCNKIKEYIKVNKKNVDITLPINGEIKGKTCLGGISGFNIDTEGNLFPCIYSVDNFEECCGNIYDGINNEVLNKFVEINNCEVEECKGCTNYKYCLTVTCKFVNKKYMGQYTKPIPILCDLQNRNFNYYKLKFKK